MQSNFSEFKPSAQNLNASGDAPLFTPSTAATAFPCWGSSVTTDQKNAPKMMISDVQDFQPAAATCGAFSTEKDSDDSNPFAGCNTEASFVPASLNPDGTPCEYKVTLEDKIAMLKSKTFVQRSMYKRELCKNFTETGKCRFGELCQYAHGEEELSEEHHLYL